MNFIKQLLALRGEHTIVTPLLFSVSPLILAQTALRLI